ncbi:adenosine deaminase [Granulicella pectinivorans]|uniref:adenosine deaminase n=1 Tax=Granulicella pectinivorans TaxID=474950 RepID=A0A1I6L3I7_9BACT|nr:adenosine deaminase [Granulicella pectinivorans]SFR98016.1 adenosine deaminase [Granulicella pectinivorans]
MFRVRASLIAAIVFAPFALHAAPPAGKLLTPGETRASKAMEVARKSPLEMHAFLAGMPKGSDLHMHLSGAIYAETFLAEAAADHLCVNPITHSFVRGEKIPCVAPDVPAENVFKDQHLYDALVDAFSMRSFVPSAGTSGHDQFFDTFGRFGGLANHNAEWLDQVATRAAAQNEQYLEIMMTPSFTASAKAGYVIGWPAENASPAQLAEVREKLLASGMRDEMAADIKQVEADLAGRKAIEHCGTPEAKPACAVTIRMIYQVLRAFPPQQVFAQTLLGFEMMQADPSTIVGINFVQPEDAYMAMSEYHRQMTMLDYLRGAYPVGHISLHAGELAPGMVPPEGMKFHIREAVELGHAERIGHGVDVMGEDNPHDLLKEMAAKHVMVEINLTSNDGILGITEPFHPLPQYRGAGVPVSLSTDDEGVSRIDLTNEYTRAALDFHLSYKELKDMARTGMEHTFLPGASLWATPDAFGTPVKACAGVPVTKPSAACEAFLATSEKAAQQWELERRFVAFEAKP